MRSKTQLLCNDSLASAKTTERRFCHVVHVLLQVFIPPNKMDISEDAPRCRTCRTCRQASTCLASPFTSAVPDQIQDSCRTLIFANKISIYLLPTHPLYYISRRQCIDPQHPFLLFSSGRQYYLFCTRQWLHLLNWPFHSSTNSGQSWNNRLGL